MLKRTFDYVLIDGKGLFTFEQFQQLPLRDQARIVLGQSAQFYSQGDPIPDKDALGNKVKPIDTNR